MYARIDVVDVDMLNVLAKEKRESNASPACVGFHIVSVLEAILCENELDESGEFRLATRVSEWTDMS